MFFPAVFFSQRGDGADIEDDDGAGSVFSLSASDDSEIQKRYTEFQGKCWL